MDTNPAPEVALEALFSKALGEDKPEGSNPAGSNPEAESEPVEADDAAEAANDTDADSETDDEGTGDDTPAAKVDDSEDVELDGEVYSLPKKVKDAVLRQKDYTQKTQELANQRRIVEDRAQYMEAREQLMQHAFKEASELEGLQAQIAQFDTVDWNGLITSDPQQALRLNFAKQQLDTQLQAKQRKVQEVVGQATAARDAHKVKQQELGRVEVERRIGKISDSERVEMLNLGQELGFAESDFMSPAALHALHLAVKARKIEASKTSIIKKVAAAKPFVAPAARSSQSSGEAQKVRELKTRYQKSGKTSDVEAFLEQRIAARRKR